MRSTTSESPFSTRYCLPATLTIAYVTERSGLRWRAPGTQSSGTFTQCPVLSCRAVKPLLLLVCLAAALSLIAPAAASASDQSVYDAYVSRDKDFAALGGDLGRALRRWEHSGHKRQRAALNVLKRGHKLIAELAAAVKAEDTSSSKGKRGKDYALATLGYLDRSFTFLARGVRARTAGHLARAKRAMAKARHFDTAAGKAEKRARKWFKAAGVHIKRDPASPNG